ncbi:5-oxoprolinase subunit PxpB [Ulvibacterium sp.]|uniref:5-oxoprolinase subunit PxpB n=1 Tax=Ulvibacterium sp. TaxID=2665914 RepID=UPI0026070DEB|nr:5-oxoprolinase subunit PxpB [Ulvibacterium sp.]
MTHYSISIRPFGIHAVLIEWPNEVNEAILENILQFQNHLKTSHLGEEEWEMIPAYNSLTLIYRKAPINFAEFEEQLKTWYAQLEETSLPQRFIWRLPVCYDLEFGIDLNSVSEKLEKDIAEIIKLHTSYTYTVYGIGFLPGFMYLGGLPSSLEVPRRAEPRLKVKKGSVGLAGKQTGIYPQESPGGWNIIGSCSVSMFDPKKKEPCFVSVGDKVQFYSITKAEYDLYKIEGEVGIYKLEKTKWDA